MSQNSHSGLRRRRHSRACARCRGRKIRCDFRLPTCGACVAAGATCLGYDSIHGVEKPRSTISHLEEEVARLELELQRVQNPNRTISDITIAAVDNLATRLATTIVDPRGSSRKQESLLPLTSPFFVSCSPVPHLSSTAWESTKDNRPGEEISGAISVSSIPRNVIEAMLKHYCEIYRPLYPGVEESELVEACDRVCDNSSPSEFDIFCVYITLAISTSTLVHRDEKRAREATYGFWATAVIHLDLVGLSSSWQRLQALQLLTHFGFLNPQMVDCSTCAAAASRLCVQLGLHQDLPASAQANLDVATLNTRRRLFWNSYSIDSAVHTVRCRPFMWSISVYPMTLPELESQSSPTYHIWSLRQIECEITMNMYHPSLSTLGAAPSNPLFSQWFESIHDRLIQWYQTTLQNVNLTEKVEFYEMHFHMQMLRLNRPSPRHPAPTRDMCKKAMNSAVAVIKEFSIIDRLGKLFYLWHAAFCLVESGICLLASVLTEMQLARNFTHLRAENITVIIRYMKIFPFLLWKICRRWPNVTEHASSLEGISVSVSESLQKWASGEIIDASDCHGLKEQLLQFSQFSPFPSDSPSDILQDAEKTRNEISTASGQVSSSISLSSINHADSEVSFGDTTTFRLATVDLQSSQDNRLSLFPETPGIDTRDTLTWEFEGMDSEEIFAALLVGSQDPIMTNTGFFSPGYKLRT